MTTAESKALGYRVYTAINAKDITALSELFDPNVIRHAAGEVGIESAIKALVNTFTASPEKRFVVEDLVAEDDKVALRVTVHGAMTDPGERLPIIMEIFRIANGRVVEVWGAAWPISQPKA